MPNGDRSETKEREAVERPWASNDKARFDDMISHSKNVDLIAEQSLQNAVTFAEKANDAYLASAKQMQDAYMEMSKNQSLAHLQFVEKLHEQYAENNRYTLDRLYSVFPEEAAGLGTMVALIVSALREAGVIAPAAAVEKK